ncbi:DUF1549 domain-containing protein [Luteolibacter ambystomatis]|uniref:DUF1549 domain-containing protein n=1 Tax=Luteolibacter ambystomatis TaxID=2824561 RepID=A0A975IZF4_9BACT|nr:DUF1549 domain-containing protein [Luteolibacter ambystomatis]QUE50863.1 DUF1549 domain-containing protein [Luteolibacter ambystomatis]
MKPLFVRWTMAVLGLVAAAPLACGQGMKAPKDDPAYLKKAALTIDQHVANWYRKQKLPVPATTDDATYLRRVFLVTIGRIPTGEEARDFLDISDPNKRQELVNYLLNSPGYGSHLTNWTFDLLRLTDQRIGGGGASMAPYRDWVRRAVDSNMPWDEFVRRLLASNGDGWDPQTASVGYYTRDRGMPLDNIANSMRIFLASRMECAQCHDNHASPDEKPERKDFYELAAFTNGQGELNQKLMQPLWSELTRQDERRGPEYSVAQVMWDRVYGMSLAGGGSGRIALPQDYQAEYHNGKPGDLVGGRTPFGKIVLMSDRRDENNGREKLADWVVSKTGPQFPSNIANRMWKRVMGKAVYEPVDTYVEAEKSNYPELMGYLQQLMVDLQFDMKAYQRVLLYTRTFQFATNPDTSIVPGGDDFHGRKIERLSSEQIWDSLITLSGGNPDLKPRRTLDDRIYVGGKPVLVGKKNMIQVSKEVLALQKESDVRAYFQKLLQDVKSDGGGGGESMMMSGIHTYNKDAQVRASELPSPAPGDHFLYLFGQSNREVVDASSREPNVGQVLSLMNGFVQRQLVNNPKAALYKTLEGATSNDEKIRRLYLAILSRPPTDQEMGWMLDEVKSSPERGYRNIVSALVMSSEFLFLQ